MVIVGFAGKKGAGKSSVAQAVFQKYRWEDRLGVGMYAFADALKQYCTTLFNLRWEQCYGTEAEKNTLTEIRWEHLPFRQPEALRTHPVYLTGREVLKIFGTDIVRSMNMDAWVNATMDSIEADNREIALISDVRFINEVEAIHYHGGRVIQLLRAPYPDDTHPSETELDGYRGFDMIVNNRQMTLTEQAVVAIKLVETWL